VAKGVPQLIRRTSLFAGACGAVLSPIPLLDELILAPTYAILAARISRRHDLALRRAPWRPILRTTIGGLAARAVVNVGVALIPGVSAVANAVTAVALTEVLGRYVDRACADPASARPLAVAEIVTLLRPRAAPQPAT
jgi:uncharacterized protein (DUF697 family)